MTNFTEVYREFTEQSLKFMARSVCYTRAQEADGVSSTWHQRTWLLPFSGLVNKTHTHAHRERRGGEGERD